jgi:hypothetical protein
MDRKQLYSEIKQNIADGEEIHIITRDGFELYHEFINKVRTKIYDHYSSLHLYSDDGIYCILHFILKNNKHYEHHFLASQLQLEIDTDLYAEILFRSMDADIKLSE